MRVGERDERERERSEGERERASEGDERLGARVSEKAQKKARE